MSEEKKDSLRLFEAWVEGDLPEREEEEVPVVRKKEREPFLPERKIEAFFDRLGEPFFRKLYRVLALLVCVSLIGVLLVVVADLPPFGNPENPGNNEVYEVYIEDTVKDTGALNAVGGLILSYRGYDTLNEAHVLFVAVCAVMVLLRIDHGNEAVDPKYVMDENDREFEPHHDPILEKSTKILTPIVLLFGLTVMLNGHLSPGGGFSGGTIAAGGLILFLVTYGFKKSRKFFGEKVFDIIHTAALCIYTLIMTYFIYMGANQLENGIPLGKPGAILSAGISLPINLVVGLEVACTMYALYALFRKGGLD